MCRLSAIKTLYYYYYYIFFFDILTLEDGTKRLSLNIETTYNFMLHTIPEESRSQSMFNFGVSFHQEIVKWWNTNVFCYITSENV